MVSLINFIEPLPNEARLQYFAVPTGLTPPGTYDIRIQSLLPGPQKIRLLAYPVRVVFRRTDDSATPGGG